MDELLYRQMPHSLEAEQAVLGSMLIDANCIKDVMEKLRPEDFYLRQNREIFETIYSMFLYSKPIDGVTVAGEMERNGTYDENTTRNYLVQLMEVTPTSANVNEYADIVRDKALLRAIATVASDITGMVQDGTGGASAVLDAAEQKIYAVRRGRSAQNMEQISVVLQGVLDHLAELSATGGKTLPGLSTGLSAVDDKINGLSYEEIAARGGGILNSADLLHRTSEEELYSQTMARVREMIAKGTGAIEIKSGYGLTLEDELKMLRVIRRVKKDSPATIKATFLGAHAVGRAFKGRQNEYVNLVCEEMIPAVAAEGLAEYVDVFCDEGFFTVAETDRILSAGERYGLIPKIHANELACSGGVQVAVKHNALSVDHLERTTDAEIEALRNSRTMPTMLPGSSFFLGIPYGRAKEYVSAGLGLALASDYNPGSSPSGDMRFVMALGCIRMRLTPAQAFNACTLNSAYAMGVAEELGSVTVGKLANLIVTKPVPSLAFIPYCHQTPFICKVLLRGKHI